MKISFAAPRLPKSGTIVVFAAEGRKLSPTGKALDKTSGGALFRAMESSRFTGRALETLAVLAPAKLGVASVLLVGSGKSDDEPGAWKNRGGVILAQLNAAGEKSAAVAVDRPGKGESKIAADLAFGARLRAYRFDKYRTKEKPEQKPSLAELVFLVTDAAGAKRAFAPLEKIADGVFFTRDLVSEPANVIYPESLAEAARWRCAKLGVEVEVLDEKQMAAARHGRAAGRGAGQRQAAPLGRDAMEGHPARATRHRSPSSARASPSIPAASPSSRPAAWRT